MNKKTAIVVGAGIVGLAVAKALAEKGYEVRVFERNAQAMGASVRNFGMIWPIGQPKGKLYERAMLSRNTWKKLCEEANIWHSTTGSLQLAYDDLELKVIDEFHSDNLYDRDIDLLTRKDILARFNGIESTNLKGGLFSTSEMIVDPREALVKIPIYLSEKHKIKFFFNTCIQKIEKNIAYSGKNEWQADKLFICSGPDFETLYPELFSRSGITKCKLQMMRTIPQRNDWQVGTSLAAGLTLIHYGAFEDCASLPALKKKFLKEMPDYVRWGIHVMVSQNGMLEFTLGDTHEYGLCHDPFNRKFLNDMILNYLSKFVKIKNLEIAQTWNGIYPKLPGKTEFIKNVDEHTTIINGLSGAGMTLSFGLGQQIVAKL